jgi:glycosyltransferase involved in cell wall biosynthesis
LQNFEVIIVNDGSTDNTQSTIREIINHNPSFQIRSIDQNNSGLAAARNSGILYARGEYILPLDADDAIAPTMLEECVNVLDHHKTISIIYTDRQDFGEVEQTVAAGKFDIEYIKYFNQISYCSMYRKQMWEQIGGYRVNMRVSEDWDFWVAAASLGYIGYHIHKPLFQYCRRSDGLFQEVAKNYEKVFAQIILNNHHVYDQNEIENAKQVLSDDSNVLMMNLVSKFFYQAKNMEARITGIESSKFWKIRNVWFQIKHAIGLKTNE